MNREEFENKLIVVENKSENTEIIENKNYNDEENKSKLKKKNQFKVNKIILTSDLLKKINNY